MDIFVYELKVPGVTYFDTYSENLMRYMQEDSINLYDIALEQQRNYALTKNIDDNTREYIDKNRFIIHRVLFKDNIIYFNTIEDHIHKKKRVIYEIQGDITMFKSIVAYLQHPMNIIYENTEEHIAYKYSQ